MRALELKRQNQRGRVPSIIYPIALLGEMQKDRMRQTPPEFWRTILGVRGGFFVF